MPKRFGSFPCGMRNVRVAAPGAPDRTKSALSQVVAAMLGLARTGSVPTQGRLILPTTGRSAAASVPGVSPDRGGSTGATVTLVGHGPEGSASQRLRTAAVSPSVAVGAVIGRPLIVSMTVETITEPVRAIPTTYVRPTSL